MKMLIAYKRDIVFLGTILLLVGSLIAIVIVVEGNKEQARIDFLAACERIYVANPNKAMDCLMKYRGVK